MYSFDYYKEKVYAEEFIPAGTTIGIPFQSVRGLKTIVEGNRLGEFLNESSSSYNSIFVKNAGFGMTNYYMLEAHTDIQPGDEIIVYPDRSLNMKKLQEINKSNKKYALTESKKFRIDNISDIMSCYENMDQCTDIKDRLELIKALKEAVRDNGLKLDLTVDEETKESKMEVFTEAAVGNSTRKKIENHVLTVFGKLDVSGINAKFYKEAFEKMNDTQFDQYMRKLLYDPDENFYLEIQAHKNEPNLKEIRDALNYMKVPLNEYVYFRYEEDPDNPVRTRYRVPTGLEVLSIK